MSEKYGKGSLLRRSAAFLFFAAAIPALAAIITVTAANLFFTTDMSTDNPWMEAVSLTEDAVIPGLLAAIATIAAVALLAWALKRVSRRRLAPALFVFTLAVGITWVISAASTPTHDSYIVTSASYDFACGDFNLLAEDEHYFQCFPFQLGYVLFGEMLARVLPVTYNTFCIIIEIINVIALAGSYAGLAHICSRLYPDGSVTRVFAVLAALSVQPVMFCTFTYGNIPGLCYAVWAAAMAADYICNGRKLYAFLCAVLIAAAVTVKLNFTIMLVAICAVLLIHALRTGRIMSVLTAVLAVILTVGAGHAVTAQYEVRADCEIGSGIPMISWLAMGLSGNKIAPGWYDGGYTVVNYETSGRDAAVASEKSAEVVAERLSDFTKEPKAAVKFFGVKLLTQFAETTYQSIWTNQVRGHTRDPGAIAGYVCGDGEAAVKRYCEIFTQGVYVAALIGVIVMLRDRREATLLLPLVFLGGVMYHMLFEAKSQYILTYYILILPVAAMGTAAIMSRISNLRGRHRLVIMKKQAKGKG